MQARIGPTFTGRPQSRDLSISLTGAHEAAGTSLVIPSLVTRAAIHLTRSAVVMLGGMSITRWPTVAHIGRTTRSAAGCRSRTLDRYGSPAWFWSNRSQPVP